MAGAATVSLVFNLLRIGFFVCILIVIFNGLRSAVGLFGGGGRGMGNALQTAAGGIKDMAEGGREVGRAIGDEVRERREIQRERRLEQLNIQLEERLGRLEATIDNYEGQNEQLLQQIDMELEQLRQLLNSRRIAEAPPMRFRGPRGRP